MTDAVPAHFAALDKRNKELNAARREKVLAAAVALAEAQGFQWITRADVAEAAGVVPASVSFAFGSMVELKRAVLSHAIETENLTIVAQGIGDKHPLVENLPNDLRARVVAFMLAA